MRRIRLACPYKACKVRNILIAGNLHEIGSLPDPLENNDTAIPDNTARDKEPVIWSTELHSPNLFQPCEELVDDLEFSVWAEREDGDRVSPWVIVWTDVTIRGVYQCGGEGFVWRGD